jgi:hypothetical protein
MLAIQKVGQGELTRFAAGAVGTAACVLIDFS